MLCRASSYNSCTSDFVRPKTSCEFLWEHCLKLQHLTQSAIRSASLSWMNSNEQEPRFMSFAGTVSAAAAWRLVYCTPVLVYTSGYLDHTPQQSVDVVQRCHCPAIHSITSIKSGVPLGSYCGGHQFDECCYTHYRRKKKKKMMGKLFFSFVCCFPTYCMCLPLTGEGKKNHFITIAQQFPGGLILSFPRLCFCSLMSTYTHHWNPQRAMTCYFRHCP